MNSLHQRRWTLARLGKLFLCLTIGFALAEGLVRIVVPDPIYYSTWFTPGVHQRDREFGFVFTPYFRGAMRHKDGVWWEPVILDANGFRERAVEREFAGTRVASTPVVMLGGASMGFSFGLPDELSLHGQLQNRLGPSHSVQSVAWPGFNLEQDLRKIERAGRPSDFRVAVVLAYSEQDYETSDQLRETSSPPNLVMRNGVVLPDDPAAGVIPSLYYRSMVMAGIARWVLVAEEKLGFRHESSETGLERGLNEGGATAPGPAVDGKPLAILAAEQLLQDGVDRVYVVALPHQLRVNGPEILPDSEPSDITWIDLRGLRDDPEMDWIAGGHYGPQSASKIARQIADIVGESTQ